MTFRDFFEAAVRAGYPGPLHNFARLVAEAPLLFRPEVRDALLAWVRGS